MTITNIAELLSESQSDFIIYDLGRRVQPIDAQTFHALCAQQQPYPYPLQDCAWFAVVFWPQQSKSSAEPFLWFLKLPLDERGLISFAAQQEFVAQVITLLGQQITGALTEQQQQQLQQSAYLFTPSEAKRAAVHAQLTCAWHKPPSRFYESARKEFLQPSEDGWQQLGIQGIHDVTTRLLDDTEATHAIAENFYRYPQPLQNALAEALEHTHPPAALKPVLIKGFWQAGATAMNALRASAGFAHEQDVQEALKQLIADADQEQLIIIAARLWPALTAELMESYLLRVAELNNPALFAGLVRDILRLPTTRLYALGLLQRNDLPTLLYQAWQQFMGRT